MTAPLVNVVFAAESVSAALAAGESATALQLLDAYSSSFDALSRRVAALDSAISEVVARGEAPTPGQIFQMQQYQSLQAQIAQEMLNNAAIAGSAISSAQARAIEIANDQLAKVVPPSPTGTNPLLNVEAVEKIAGTTSQGPLSDLLIKRAGADADAARRALQESIMLGWNPKRTKAALNRAVTGGLANSLTIARTEQLRAYREASRANYAANNDVVKGWIWHAALTDRSCAFCWGMHGSHHDLDEPMASHPNCRCTMLPDTGLLAVTPGPTAFSSLSSSQQEEILGKGKKEAYDAGTLQITDLVGKKQHPLWGPVGYEKSLGEALRPRKAFTPLQRNSPLVKELHLPKKAPATPREKLSLAKEDPLLTPGSADGEIFTKIQRRQTLTKSEYERWGENYSAKYGMPEEHGASLRASRSAPRTAPRKASPAPILKEAPVPVRAADILPEEPAALFDYDEIRGKGKTAAAITKEKTKSDIKKNGYTQAELTAADTWVKEDFIWINAHLRKGSDPKPGVTETIQNLDTMFEKSGLDQDYRVWRNIYDLNEPEGGWEALVGTTRFDPGYQSTTIDRRFAFGEEKNSFGGNLVYRIDLPKGYKAVWPDVNGYYKYKQGEILLNRGTSLKITGVERVGYKTVLIMEPA